MFPFTEDTHESVRKEKIGLCTIYGIAAFANPIFIGGYFLSTFIKHNALFKIILFPVACGSGYLGYHVWSDCRKQTYNFLEEVEKSEKNILFRH